MCQRIDQIVFKEQTIWCMYGVPANGFLITRPKRETIQKVINRSDQTN